MYATVRSVRCATNTGFNQALTREQCERLLSQLAATAFPFLCAHGRPSVVCIRTHMHGRAAPVRWHALLHP